MPPCLSGQYNRFLHTLQVPFSFSNTSLTRPPLPLRSAVLPFNPASKQDDRRGSQRHAAIGREEPRTPKTGAALRLLRAKRFGVRQLAAAFSPTSLLAVLLSSRLPDGQGRLGKIPRASSRGGKRQQAAAL